MQPSWSDIDPTPIFLGVILLIWVLLYKNRKWQRTRADERRVADAFEMSQRIERLKH